MSNVKIQSNASGTGTLTIAAPNTNTDRTLTLPDSSGTMATAESTLAQFNASGSAPVYACRAWVNFNGTGTPAVRAAGNVSFIVDLGVGDYVVVFTTAMPDANYSAVVSAQIESNGTNWVVPSLHRDGNPFNTGSVRVSMNPSGAGGGGNVDGDYICVAIFR
jgi:hypothetical protein